MHHVAGILTGLQGAFLLDRMRVHRNGLFHPRPRARPLFTLLLVGTALHRVADGQEGVFLGFGIWLFRGKNCPQLLLDRGFLFDRCLGVGALGRLSGVL